MVACASQPKDPRRTGGEEKICFVAVRPGNGTNSNAGSKWGGWGCSLRVIVYHVAARGAARAVVARGHERCRIAH